MFLDVPICSQMFLYVPVCSCMFLGVPRCSQMFLDVPRCSQMFPDVPKCSQMFPNVPRCSQIFLDVLRCSLWSSTTSISDGIFSAIGDSPCIKQTILSHFLPLVYTFFRLRCDKRWWSHNNILKHTMCQGRVHKKYSKSVPNLPCPCLVLSTKYGFFSIALAMLFQYQ